MKCFKAPPAPTLDTQRSHLTTSEAPPPSQYHEAPQLQPRTGGRARVPHYMEQARYLEERPRGIGKGAFSEHFNTAVSVATDDPAHYRFSKRSVVPPQRQDKPSCKKMRASTPARDPILQDDPSFSGQPTSMKRQGLPAPLDATVYSTQRRYCLPSELGVSKNF